MKTIFSILLIVVCLHSKAHTYGVITGRIDKVYYTGIVAGETKYQNQAIAFLCNEFIKKYYPSFKGKVFLELGFSDHGYKLSYDKFQGDKWENAESNRPAKGNGVRIRLSQSCNRAESVLKLLEYGIIHLASLKRLNKDYYNLEYYERPDEMTIDSIELKKVVKAPISEKIKQTLGIKVYRNLGKEEYNVNKEYYFQNDKYCFIDFLDKDKSYLELSQVYQIISHYYLGSLIFDTDSSGYFYNRETKTLSSKFILKNKIPSFYFEHTSTDSHTKRIYFEYTISRQEKRKFIYLSDKLFLIQKIEEYEDELIERQLRTIQKTSHK